MKKVTSYVYIILAFMGITFFSCNLRLEDTSLSDKPGVNVTSNQITLIIPKISADTKYINVYRRDKDNDTIVNIGVLYHPQALENDNKNYCYIDTLVTTGKFYDYRVRYYSRGEYTYSEWSDKIKIETGTASYASTYHLSYQANNATLIYDRTNYTLTIDGTIIEPDFSEFTSEHYKPMLIIKSPDATQAFEINSTADGTVITLRGMLPLDFLDKDLTIEGIVGQKTIYDDPTKPEDERQIKSVVWTAPTVITLFGAGSNKINVPAQTGSAGLDYSRRG